MFLDWFVWVSDWSRSLCMLQVIQSQPVSETCDTWSYGVVSRTLATTYTRKKTEKANLKCWEVYFVTKGSGILCCDNILQLRQVIEEKSWQCEHTLWLHKRIRLILTILIKIFLTLLKAETVKTENNF